MTSEHKENMEFEAEVRRVAEAIWQLDPGGCQPEHYSSNPVIRELDGLAKLRDITHLLMVTVSRKLEKAKSDIKKLNAAEKIEARPDSPVTKWLITKYQLDAEHINFAKKNKVVVLTLDQFRNRFFNARDYLSKRRSAPFGSARNLNDGTVSVPENEYVELPITLQKYEFVITAKTAPETIETTIQDISERLVRGEVVIMIAPFGSGKSLSAREVFFTLMKQRFKEEISMVPIAVNLREHWGQEFGDEILDRHARSIGFSPRENLTIAWRAGIIALIVDGFDEVASQVVGRVDQVNFMREARRQALHGTRDLIGKAPSGVGILVCGRDHYFDSLSEMVQSLGITGRAFSLVRLGEFTEGQAEAYLKKKGTSLSLPDWLPRKPLMLGYLAHQGLLDPILNIDSSKGYGYAWDEFLRLICEREATHERAAMESETVRRVLERLSCDVRATISGTGPITGRELADAYLAETGQLPGEGVLMQLQRLPGLTEREQDPGARSFVDEDMLAALQGSALTSLVLGEMRGLSNKIWLSELSSKAVAMASYMLRKKGADVSTLMTAALRYSRFDGSPTYEVQLSADCMAVAIEMAREAGRLDCGGLRLESIGLGRLDIEEITINNLEIRDSTINEVVLGASSLTSTLYFRDCLINRVSGVSSEHGLPEGMFVNCDISEFDDMSTNAAVIRSNMMPPIKALITVLRKLYFQGGGARKIGALKRGLPQGKILDSVDEVVRILEAEGLISVSNEFVHPVRRQVQRVYNIINAPNLSSDAVVTRVNQLRS